ncbi:mating-type switching protein swi1 [Purpureocillium lilacinum]|uniref:Topoisomerase 1-associated factor 1 n=1 Tax=Purpureocillium lilacinum TaxID=33203 RepID=A0A179GJ65_PURLI|nr:mating-type switching protein swi1 [Purpureocillium lilacinum]GJN75326.1 topoisomerase 1-associated factor 1 [Purpureocillium lilacinum]
MEPLDGSADTVHPEVRAHVNSLVSALGGISADGDGQYQLGDDALEVLRDIKRWIRFYDEKTNRMDVARCIHDANLVEGDLLPILAQWPENAMDNRFKARIALSCFEVMVPLTWPMERDKERMTVNHHRHMPVLELAQVQYKRAIINFDGARILHTAVRAALPSMAIPAGDRTPRDQGIIKLVLFFLRNMAMITPPPDVKYDGDETQISRSATIDAFSYQDIFIFILTLASNMGDEFRTEDTTVMEIIYHLVKRVDQQKLFMNEQQLNKAKAGELSAMMNKESAMLKAYNRKGPTRHNRFGTMVWVQRDDGKMSSLSGQDALADATTRNQKIDSSKTFKPPRRARKENKDERELGLPPKLNARANDQLRGFVEEFLDSGFNPLFQHVRKTIDREAPHVMQYHRRQFFYLVAWFLEAERVRRASKKGASRSESDVSSFNLVAGVLNQEMFITLNRALHESYDFKDWQELTAVMRCFTQILLTVQEMSACGNDDDEEIAENVLSRLFYEESTHDAIANIIRGYKDQGFDYLDAATELVHNYLRILEAYSKQNVDMQVRSRKRTRRKKRDAQVVEGEDNTEENDDSADDEQDAERTSKERKFDFHRFAARFTPQGVVDTFTTFTKYYRDLSEAQLKRAHRYFYRLAFKQDMSVMLFRVDIIHLLYNMVKGPEPLDKSSSSFKDWEELVKQILRKCFKKIEERPELVVEMLFSKLQGIAFFLEYGYERQTAASKAKARPATELEFRHTEERDRQVAIVVGAMLDRNENDLIDWVKRVLSDAENERRSWVAAEQALPSVEDPFEEESAGDKEPKKPPMITIRPDDQTRRTAMFKNSYLRLLMTVCGFQRLGPASEETAESVWIVPDDVAADHLKDSLHFINQAEFSPPTFEDGVLAEHQLRRKTVPRKKAAFDDDEDGDDAALEDEFLFPAGGPTEHRAIDAPKKAKKTRRRRRKDSAEPPDEAELDEKARRRREKELEKARRIKSALYVREGDDEFDSDEDEAFFARERAIAERARKAAESARGELDRDITASTAGRKKRKSEALLAVSDDDDDDDEDDDLRFAQRVLSSQEEPAESDTDDTPVDVSEGEGRKRRRLSDEADGEQEEDGDVDMDVDGVAAKQPDSAAADGDGDGAADGDDAPVVVTRRPRVRGGFVVDSDDDD